MKKKLIAALALVCSCSGVMAQTYVQGGLGAYMANQYTANNTNSPAVNGVGYNAGVTVGFKKHRWQADAGFKFMQHSAKKTYYLRFEEDLNPITGEIATTAMEMKDRYSYVFLPITVGYEVVKKKSWALVPYVGIAGSYNIKSEGKMVKGHNARNEWYELEMDHKLGVWAGLGVSLRANLNKKITLTAGPETWYMLNSFSSFLAEKQRTLTVGLNVGIQYSL